MRKYREEKYTDDEIIAGIQKCAEDLGDPSFGIKRYVEWREGQEKGVYASAPLIIRRVLYPSGDRGWSAWKVAAGQKSNGRRGGENFGKASFTEQEMYLALARLEGSLGSFPTVMEYEAMRLKTEPSIATIRYRMGRWSQTLSQYRDWKKSHCKETWNIEIPQD